MENNIFIHQFLDKCKCKKYFKKKLSKFIDIMFQSEDFNPLLIECIEFLLKYFNLSYKLVKK